MTKKTPTGPLSYISLFSEPKVALAAIKRTPNPALEKSLGTRP